MSGRSRTARLALAAVLAVGSGAACRDGDPRDLQASLSLTATLGGADTAGYARARSSRPFVFPADHGPHPDFRTEWWYVTGNLDGAGGRRFGYQLTLFRSALAPPDAAPAAAASPWATRQAWMGHFALTDVAGGRFHAAERFAREAGGLAGAAASPLRVRVEGWSLASADSGATFPLRVRAADDGFGVDLVLEAGKPTVVHGEDGLSRKGPGDGNASYYYARTRMPTRGTVASGGDTVAVSGTSWLDREWSTSSLPDGVEGWDWFALQLDDGRELMVYRLRRADGSATPFSDGALVDARGRRTPLRWGEDVTVQATGRWRSPVDGAAYPSGWRVELPGRGWVLDVRPVLEDQELDLAFRYWEGAVDVSGRTGLGPVRGRGYVELTGYAGRPPAR